jgi:hypothetical protein
MVDGAEGAEHLALRGDERDARVGNHVQVGNREVLAHERVLAGVLDDQRLPGGHDVLAEGVRQRRLPPRRPGLREAHARGEELPILVHEGDQRHGHTEDRGREAGQPLEGLFGRAVEQVRPA